MGAFLANPMYKICKIAQRATI